ncbi:MAG: NlpC/P60 family protein [Pseudomonadota bacterium]
MIEPSTHLHWSAAYIGKPFLPLGENGEGFDCWRLVTAVYRDELGIALPDYTGGMSAFERAEVAALIKGAVASSMWTPVTEILPFDVLVFRRGRLATHVGVAIDARQMLHVDEERPAHVARFDRSPWRECRTAAVRYSGGFGS